MVGLTLRQAQDERDISEFVSRVKVETSRSSSYSNFSIHRTLPLILSLSKGELHRNAAAT